MYEIAYTTRFKKDFKLCVKRNYDTNLFEKTIEILVNDGGLPIQHKPHKLSGDFSDHWECHIKPDWLLIWLQDEENKIITLVRTGTHSDLF